MRFGCLWLILLCASAAMAEDLNQFSLASQHDWSAKKGVFIVLDNRYAGQPSTLEKMRLTVAVGDGKSWQIRNTSDAFAYQQLYTVKLQLDGKSATVWVNGEQREQFPAGFVLAGGAVFAFDNPDWARRPAEYLVLQQSLTIRTLEGTKTFEGAGTFDARRYLFSPGSAQTHDVALSLPLTIEAVFRIYPYPDLKALSPLIDRYGQVNFATWDGKITSDVQLKQSIAAEDAKLVEWEKQLPAQDKFGGRTDLGWKGEATGFFHLMKRSGQWWLISPEGNPSFFTGICNAPSLHWDATPVTGREFVFESLPPTDGPYKSAWGNDYWGDLKTRYLAPQAASLIAQFGDAWRETETERAIRRMRAWGFSGMGKWTLLPQQTKLPVLKREGVANLVRHPDTFDPAIRERFRAALAEQVAGQQKDPYIIGWSLGNEMDETFSPEEVRAILRRDDEAPAGKRAMIDFAVQKIFGGDVKQLAGAWNVSADSAQDLYNLKLKPRPQDIEPLRLFVADNYFAFVYRTMKELDPNHLYFGHWILPTYWHNENDWRHVAPHCDVIGFDLYEYDFNDEKVQKVIRESNKPVFCGEFAFVPYWDGQRGYGRFRTAVKDEQEAGQRYAQWVKAAATNPYCIGVSVFQYRDEPVTGRGPVARSAPAAVMGENYAFGMVDVTNQPRWRLLEQVREANVSASKWRMQKQ